MIWLETQERMKRMKKEHVKIRVTAACVMRGVECTGNNFSYIDLVEDEHAPVAEEVRKRKRLFLADSWLGSVTTVENFMESRHHGTFIVKTSHTRSPKMVRCDNEGYVWWNMDYVERHNRGAEL